MEFALGLATGMLIMLAIAIRLKVEFERQIEKLKDFEVWKEWKNQE